MSERGLGMISYCSWQWGGRGYVKILTTIFTDSKLIGVPLYGEAKAYAEPIWENLKTKRLGSLETETLFWYELLKLSDEKQIQVGPFEISPDIFNAAVIPQYSEKPISIPYDKISKVKIEKPQDYNGDGNFQVWVGLKVGYSSMKDMFIGELGKGHVTGLIIKPSISDKFRSLILDTPLAQKLK